MGKLLEITAKEVGYEYDSTLSWGKKNKIIKKGYFRIKLKTKDGENCSSMVFKDKEIAQKIADNMNKYGLGVHSVVEGGNR